MRNEGKCTLICDSTSSAECISMQFGAQRGLDLDPCEICYQLYFCQNWRSTLLLGIGKFIDYHLLGFEDSRRKTGNILVIGVLVGRKNFEFPAEEIVPPSSATLLARFRGFMHNVSGSLEGFHVPIPPINIHLSELAIRQTTPKWLEGRTRGLKSFVVSNLAHNIARWGNFQG